MKSLLAAILAGIFSLFGLHQPLSYHAPVSPRGALVASAAAALATVPSSSPAPQLQTGAATSATTTIISQYITQPIVERVVQTSDLSTQTYVTDAELNAQLQFFRNSLPLAVYSPASFSGPAAYTPATTQTVALTSAIDQLTGTTLKSVTVNGVSGLTAADIPSLSGTYLAMSASSTPSGIDVSTAVATAEQTARSLADRFSDAPTVKDYSGIDCTGNSDLSTGFQYALNHNPGALRIPGNCTLVVGGMTLPQSIVLIGDGPTSVLKNKAGASTHMLAEHNTGAFVGLLQLTLDGNFQNNGGDDNQSWGTFRMYAGGASASAPATVVIDNVTFTNGGNFDTSTFYPTTPYYTDWFETNTRHYGGADGYQAGSFDGNVNITLTNVVIDPQRLPNSSTAVGRAGYIFFKNASTDTTYNSLTASNVQCFNTGISASATLGCIDSYHGGDHFIIADSFSKNAIGRGFTWKPDTQHIILSNVIVSNLAANPSNPNGNVINAAFGMNSGTITSVGSDLVMTGVQCINSGSDCISFNAPNSLSTPTGAFASALITNFVIDGCGSGRNGISFNDATNLTISNGLIKGCDVSIKGSDDGMLATGPVTITNVRQYGSGKPSFDSTTKANSLWYARNIVETPLSSNDLALTVTSNAVGAWNPLVIADTGASSPTLKTITGVPDGETITVMPSSSSHALILAPGGNLAIASSITMNFASSSIKFQSSNGTLYPVSSFSQDFYFNGSGLAIGSGNVTSSVNLGSLRGLLGYVSSPATGVSGVILQGGSTKGISFNVNSATLGQGNAAVITSGGLFGIGTSSPQGLLDVTGSSVGTDSTLFDGTRAISLINTNTTNNNMSGFDFRTNDANGLLSTGAKIMGVYTSHAAGAVSGDLVFLTKNAGTITEKMRITGAGNVGIGNTVPSYALDVAGFINTDQYSGYKQAGNTILYASSTNFTTFGGIGAGAGIIASATSSDVTSGAFSTAFGYQALANATSSATTDLSGNTAFGYKALLGSASNALANQSTAVGYKALTAVTTGAANVAVGYNALLALTSSSNNIAIGLNALASLTTATGGNVCMGVSACSGITSSNRNTGIGNLALRRPNGNDNTAIGNSAGAGVISNNFSNVTLLGSNAGTALTTGSQNIFIGKDAASTSATGANNIVLGYDIALPSTNGSNQLDIGNLIFGTGINGEGTTLSTGSIGIATSTPWRTLSVTGTVGFSNLSSVSANQTAYLCLSSNNEVVQDSTTCLASSLRFKQNVEPLSASSSLAEILALNPVSFQYTPQYNGSLQSDPNFNGTFVGFIAEDVAKIDPRLITVDATGSTPSAPHGVRYENITAILAGAVHEIATVSDTFKDNLITWLGDSENGIHDLYATIIHSQEEHTQKLCVGDTCVTPAQFQAMVAAANQSSTGTSVTSSATPPPSQSNTASTTPDTPPVIQINGDNPAIIHVGDTYNDLDATITGPQADLNLGIRTFLNGTLTSNIVLDTSAVATDTIDYVATDQSGNTSTSTRMVIIDAATPSITPPPSDPLTTTQATSIAP